MSDISVVEALWAFLTITGIANVIFARRDKSIVRGYAHGLTGIGAIFAGIGGMGQHRDWLLDPLITAGSILMLTGIAGTVFLWLREEDARERKTGSE